ncbi:dipeptide ABC transporter membrane subunit DppC [Rhodovastum atsumiense]|uniref:ABC transporter permease n=1 Tax=Rhodovastum atsumiense TaxID=504468 RepID=A0A5M6IQR8_9PROT|nr:ABC transporter permease [Rhodovastum atsumiense]KAA5609908.1 ABC transporter permease [Rhodovastum atsumiense]CAH2604523.1 dipeptide ABC transporter membrane subunit DppC [Rhodovastum atsumiense]
MKRFLAAMLRNPTTSIGIVLCGLVVLGAVLAPWIAPYDPVDQNIIERLQPPGGDFLLGTDTYGRDVLSRILWGARISLVIAVTSIGSAILIGGAIGMVSGYVGGRFDLFMMQLMDIMLSFPSLILGLIVVALLGPELINLVIAISLTAIAPFARIARAPVLTLKERAFVEAGRALGFSHARVLFVHILPNILSEVLVMGSLWMATAVRTEASLSFIGLGVKPPTATWGGMMRDGFENILDAPWLSIWPGIAILMLVLGLNMVGDGLRDATDPKLSGT